MDTLKFKTNINCSGCINAVTPHLNKLDSIKNWTVDTLNPDKILTIETEDEALSAAVITETIEKAGFKISVLNP